MPEPRQIALKPLFNTIDGEIEVGTVFPMQIPDGPAIAVTCLHLFGPAGGLDHQVSPEMLPRFVQGAELRDPLTEEVVVSVGAPLLLAGASAENLQCDVAAFVLPPDYGLPVLSPAPTQPKPDTLMLLAGRVNSGAPRTQLLHRARYRGKDPKGLLRIEHENVKLALGGTSGGPALNEAGEVSGLHVRYHADPATGMLESLLIPAERVLALVQPVLKGTPARRGGILSRLFG